MSLLLFLDARAASASWALALHRRRPDWGAQTMIEELASKSHTANRPPRSVT